MTDFVRELADLDALEQRLREELAATPPNTPSNCTCGRTLNQHLEEDIAACDVLRLLIRDGNMAPLMNKWLEHGEEYLSYAMTNLYKHLRTAEYVAMMNILATKLWHRFGMLLKDFAPYNIGLPKTPLL